MTCPKRAKLRWFQFRLRSLLLFVLVVSVGMSTFVVFNRAALIQREAVMAIIAARGSVQYDYEAQPVSSDDEGWRQRCTPRGPAWVRKIVGDHFYSNVVRANLTSDLGADQLARLPELSHVHLNGPRVTDAALRHLQGLKKLRQLDLSESHITDAGLECLKPMYNLVALNLSKTRITSAGLKKLQDLPIAKLVLRETQVDAVNLEAMSGLIYLDLTGSPVTDAGLNKAAGPCKLSLLSLANTRITDDGLQCLRRMNHLCTLDLSGTKITGAGLTRPGGAAIIETLDLTNTNLNDAGLRCLAGSYDITFLFLGGTRITDNGLRYLAQMNQLRHLDLSHTDATDAGLDNLKSIRELSLQLKGSRVTPEGAKRLQAALPQWIVMPESSSRRGDNWGWSGGP